MSAELLPEQRIENLVSPETKSHLLFQIIGPTSSGKTTLAKLISQKLEFQLVKERFRENPFFDDYYRDPDRWSFQAQVWWLLDKGERIAEFVVPSLSQGPVVSEPAPEGDRLYAHARLGNSPLERQLYDKIFNRFVSQGRFPRPDLVLYARVSFPGMLHRIITRAKRDPERAIELREKEEYWRRLWELHEQWYEQNPQGLRIFPINTERWDFSLETNNQDAQDAVIREVLDRSSRFLIDPETGESKLPEKVIIPKAILAHRPPATLAPG